MTEPTAGHNHSPDGRTKAVAERIVRLNEELRAIASDVRDVYKEAKSTGHDVKALRVLVKRLEEDGSAKIKREEFEAVVDTYLAAAGLI